MNKRKLGRTNLHISELCLSTSKFRWIDDEAAAFGLLDAYRSHDGNFIQNVGTCPGTAGAQTVTDQGEAIVGRWHQRRAIPRDSLVLATRIDLLRPVHGGSISFANLIRESCENSLRRLQTNHLDLLICEWDDQLTPVEDLLEAVDRLQQAGIVRHVVAGGFPPWRVVDSLHRSGQRNHCRFEAMEAEFSLITRMRFEGEALAMCREHRLGFLARSPLAGGFLAPPPLSTRDLANVEPTWQNERFGNSGGDAVLAALAKLTEEGGATPAQIALAWVLRNPEVSAAVVSPTSPGDLHELIQASGLQLSADGVCALNEASRAPSHGLALQHA
ncbi:MAG: aldo/keto reductase [Opitutaceae bacterium]